MSARGYAFGVMLAWIVMGLGATIYMKRDDIDSFGIKLFVLGGVALAALAWPISVPTTLAVMAKISFGKLVEHVAKTGEKTMKKIKRQE